MASNAIRRTPNRVDVKQTGGLQSSRASPIHLLVAINLTAHVTHASGLEKLATQHPQYVILLLTAHKFLGPINHLLLLLWVILVLLYKTLVRYVHGLLDGRPLFNALYPFLNVWHVINLDTCVECSMCPAVMFECDA